eukprot:gene3634-7242_t
MLSEVEKQGAVDDFVEILKFPTISGIGPVNGSYDDCSQWLLNKCNGIKLDTAFILPESKPHKPIVVSTWIGTDPSLPCILLNSHYDVVPVMDEHWNVPAFQGLRKDGRIYGRGAQDMKCVCIQYLTAISKLKASNYKPLRTIHLSYVPDEEVSGIEGMQLLLTSEWYRTINIGLALDEGLANENNAFSVFYGERLPWWVQVKANGNTGHGSRFIEGTAVELILGIANKALAFRQEQKDILFGAGKHAGCSHSIAAKKVLGDVTSLNITKLHAGVSSGGKDVYNVVPAEAEAAFDIRIAPHTTPEQMANTLDQWCREVQSSVPGLPSHESSSSPSPSGLHWDLVCGSNRSQGHAVSTAAGPWWDLFTSTIQKEFNTPILAQVFPAATDSRFLRALGVRAFGFSPIRNSPILLHEHNEYLDENVFLEGCEVYISLIKALASQERIPDDDN